MSLVPPARSAVGPADPGALLDAELARISVRILGVRARLFGLVALAAVVLAALDPQTWRVALLGSLATFAVVAGFWTARRAAQAGALAPREVPRNLLGMWVLQLGAVVGTGGLESPLVPVLVPLAFAAGLLVRPWLVVALVGGQSLLVVGLALFQTTNHEFSLAYPQLRGAVVEVGSARAYRLGLSAFVLVNAFSISAFVGTLIRRLFEQTLARSLVARAAELEAYRQHSQDLQRLSGEIAHELKNPLAAIKGLAALLARDLPEGRPAERARVMRGEIDRLQSTLDDFLTFSRPTGPLQVRNTPLLPLLQNLISLHEVAAAERGLRLVLSADVAELAVDPKKLTQILVNLLLNAMAASPAGGQIVVRSVRLADQHVVEVLDEGPGPPPGLRIFQAGVSGRPEGAGLGLPIALTLARQHGGDLELVSRPEGGTCARLRIPLVHVQSETP
jgi:two-component system sensor histidine kinase HydH